MSEPEIAVVAGGSGAIGRVIVRRLAARGLTVVVVGRDAAALEGLAREIEAVRPCVADLSNDAAIATLAATLVGPVRMIVHSVGVPVADGVGNAALVDLSRQLSLAYGPRGITSHVIAPGPVDTERLGDRAAARARGRRHDRLDPHARFRPPSRPALNPFVSPRRRPMPVAHINLLRGHSREVLREIVVETCEVMARVLGAPKERLIVWITENDPDLWAIGGIPAGEAFAEGDRRTLETPFVQMVLMEGRPKEQLHAVMAGISEVVSRATGIDIGRVRVHVAPAQPDTWSIGGVPAAVARAAELAARARASA